MSVFLKNIHLKIMALVLAVVSWYAIRETISFEITVPDVPVEVRVGEGWSVLRQSAGSVSVAFRGSQDDIRLIDPKQLRAVVAIEAASNFINQVIEFVPEHIVGRRGVRITRIAPERLEVSLDRAAERKVPVKAIAVGRPFSGELESVTCEPAVVSLRGPASMLQKTDWVSTEPVDLEGRSGSFQKRCRIQPPSNIWTPIIDPAEVQVNVVIVQQAAVRTWDNVPLAVLNAPRETARINLSPASVQVSARGRAEVINSLTNMMPYAFVDCRNLDPSLTYDLPVTVYFPLNVSVTAVAEPAMARVGFEYPALRAAPGLLPAEGKSE